MISLCQKTDIHTMNIRFFIIRTPQKAMSIPEAAL